mgnify:CR=1 FL=1
MNNNRHKANTTQNVLSNSLFRNRDDETRALYIKEFERFIYILRSPLLDINGKVANRDSPLNEISNVNFDYSVQTLYDLVV